MLTELNVPQISGFPIMHLCQFVTAEVTQCHWQWLGVECISGFPVWHSVPQCDIVWVWNSVTQYHWHTGASVDFQCDAIQSHWPDGRHITVKLPCKLQANDLVMGKKHQHNILNAQMFIMQPSETIFCSARNTCVFDACLWHCWLHRFSRYLQNISNEILTKNQNISCSKQEVSLASLTSSFWRQQPRT